MATIAAPPPMALPAAAYNATIITLTVVEPDNAPSTLRGEMLVIMVMQLNMDVASLTILAVCLMVLTAMLELAKSSTLARMESSAETLMTARKDCFAEPGLEIAMEFAQRLLTP
jgi:hypothetical protein